jgi:hypothetical protein
MATYVNDLRLKEIGTGESSGTWGTETNTNLELIAEAFSFGTEAITTNADTHTTTIADGSTDPGRSLYLKYTGTLDSACTITIGPNTVSKLWFIENGTSGSQNIIISQGSGANVTIPAGHVKAIYSDGAGSGAAMVDAFTDLNLAGTTTVSVLSVSSTTTFSDDVTFTGASNNLVWDKSDNCLEFADNAKAKFGTGGDLELYHDGSSSYLVNTTGDLYLRDSNGDIYIQGKSGESSINVLNDGAVELFFDNSKKLETVSGGITVTGAINDMTIAAGNIQTNTSNNLSINTPNSLRINIDSNNDGTSENFIIGHNQTAVDASNNVLLLVQESGKVSIGGTNPNATLQVGEGTTSGDATNPAIQIGRTSSYRFGMYASTEGAVIENKNGDDGIQFRVKTAGEAMRIDGGTGHCGIGVSDPADRLHVALDSGTTNAEVEVVRIEATSSGTPAVGFGPFIDFRGDRINGGPDSYGRLGFEADNMPSTTVDGAFIVQTAIDGSYSERVRVSSTGNVSINNTSASSMSANANELVVGTGSGDQGMSIYAGTSTGRYAFARAVGNNTDAYDGGLAYDGSRNLTFRTNADTERMRIDGSGRILIATTVSNPVSIADHRLVVELNSSFAGIAVGGDGLVDTRAVMNFYNDNGGVGSITTNGSSTAYNTSSDYRLKENVDYTWDATTRLKQLKPARFNFIADKDTTLDGFLAHEVSSIVPESVTGEKDGAEMQGIDQSKLVPLLVKTIQELEARITALES